MRRRAFKGLSLESAGEQRVQALFGRILTSIALGFSLLGVLGIALGWRVTPLFLGLSLIFSVFALAILMAALLPVQNVVGACVVAALFGGLSQAATHETGVPFGQNVYTQDNQRLLFGVVLWPVTWMFCLLACRGVSRCLLRPLRKSGAYGLWQLVSTGSMMMLTGFSIELLGIKALRYWTWVPTQWPMAMAGVPLVTLAGWLFVTMLTLAFATPILINKKPGPTPPPGVHPAPLWAGVEAWIIAALFKHGLTGEALFLAVLVGAILIAAIVFGMRSARKTTASARDLI